MTLISNSRGWRFKVITIATLCAAGAIAATSGSAQAKSPAEGPFAGSRYVALGSSFAAGSGDGPIKPGTPQRCGRSFNNYPTLLAEALRMVLVDVTCGGATTAHVLGPWNELPAQIDAVTSDTRLVTITIGGNDIGYVAYLIGESCKQGRELPAMAGGAKCFEPKVPEEEAYQRLDASLRAIVAQIKERAPRARIVFVQYLALVPKAPCADVPLTPAAAQTGREIGTRLASLTAKVARDTGSTLFAADNIAKKRLPCGKAEAWVTGWPVGYKPGDAFPWHPTSAGHAVIAREVAERFDGSTQFTNSLFE